MFIKIEESINIYHRPILIFLLSATLFITLPLLSPSLAGAVCTDNDGDKYGSPGDPSCEGGPQTDCNDDDPTMYPGAPRLCDGKDNDCNGRIDFRTDVDADGDGVLWCASDCDDSNPDRFPGNPEVCDGIDNDCDGLRLSTEYDIDGDGSRLCDATPDCNDYDATSYPGAPEICSDSKDNNCDGTVDEAACVCPDSDGDGQQLAVCGGTDCDDSDPMVYLNAPEICTDGIDNDCDGLIDINDPDAVSCPACTDVDGDGYWIGPDGCGETDCDDGDENVYPGAPEICDGKDSDCDGRKSKTDVDADNDGTPWCGGDCKDNDPAIFPGQAELCDGIDNDCDGLLRSDEHDSDNDGYRICDIPGDCNDFNSSINPGVLEVCSDFIDNNCDGAIDEAGCTCPDADGDGQTSSVCGGTDCDDSNPNVYLGAVEVCGDSLDNDCDNQTDCADTADCAADPVCAACSATDTDGDGFSTTGGGCGPVDCDDGDPNVYPGADEICDGKDTDCDGRQALTDVDQDNDGVAWCAGDCNDTDPDRYPGNREICDDLIDNDCDNKIDGIDSDCVFSCDIKTNPKDGPHMFDLLDPGDDSIIKTACTWCHFDDTATIDERTECQRCHADPFDPSDPLNGVLKFDYPFAPPYGFGTAQNVAMHSSSVLGIKYGNWDMSCLNCHNPHLQEQNNVYGISYGKYIKEYICYDNIVTGQSYEEIIEFTSDTGTGSFADGAPYTENICEMCHTQTNHHQRDGDAPGGQSHYDGDKCTDCHTHASGFRPGASGQAHQTHLFEPYGPDIDCVDCHGLYSAPLFADGNPLATTTVCDNCHSPGGAFDGVDDPVIGAKNNWPDGVYDGTAFIAGRLTAGKEDWCAGCHDDSPSNSMADGSGVSARNVTGDSATYGFYITGHGNGGVECTHCHDTSKLHIDHDYSDVNRVIGVWGKTFDPIPNPTNYRFYDSKSIELPHYCVQPIGVTVPAYCDDNGWNPEPAEVSDFALCFSCHDQNLLTDISGASTNYIDSARVGSENLHYLHIFSLTASRNSTCIFCHDPHGTDRNRMIDESNMGIITSICYSSSDDLYYVLGSPECDNPTLEKGGGFFGATWNPIKPYCGACHGNINPADGGQPFNKYNLYVRDYTPFAYNVDFDYDDDTLEDDIDNCPAVVNPTQEDTDLDGFGNLCDNCPFTKSPFQTDTDSDGIGDICDACPDDPDNDFDNDGICGDVDACPLDADNDIDGDGICGDVDNCPDDANPGQEDLDLDGLGDACDASCDITSTAVQWVEQFGTAAAEQANDMAIDGNDDVYVVGNRSNGGTITIRKYNSQRTMLGEKQIISGNGNSLDVDAAGNMYVSGYTTGYLGQAGGSNAGLTDVFIHKYDAGDQFGDPVWKMQIGTTGYDQAYDAVADSSGNVYVTGLTYGSLFEPKTGRGDLFIAKYDTNSDPGLGPVWFHQYGVIPSNDYIPIAMAMDESESYLYILARQDTGSYIFLYKYAVDGTPVYEHTSAGGLVGKDITVDSLSNIYVAGYIGGDAVLKKYNTDTVLQWTKTLASSASDYGYGVTLDDTESFAYLAGYTNGDIDSDGSPTNQGLDDIFIAMYDLSDPGNAPVWVEQYGTSGYDRGRKIALDSNSIKYIAGDMDGALVLLKAVECP